MSSLTPTILFRLENFSFFAIQAAVLESRRQRDEETEVGDIFEGNGESDSSIGSVSNSRFIIFKNLIEKRSIVFLKSMDFLNEN